MSKRKTTHSSARPETKRLVKQGKLLVLLFVLLALLIPMALYAQDTSANPDDWARIQEEGRMIVGTSADYQPFEYYNSNFELDGFDIALMDEIGERLGIEIVWNDFAFSGLLDALNLGQVDSAISAISVTPERSAEVDFSNLYLSANDAALVQSGSGITVRSVTDFAGHTVGVERGTTYQSWLQQNAVEKGVITQDQLVAFDSVDAMVTALEEGEIEIALLGYAPAQQIDRASPNLTVGGTKFNVQQFAIAARPGSTLIAPINQALSEIMADGTWDELIVHYLAVDAGIVLPPAGEDGTAALVPTATPPEAPTVSVSPTAPAVITTPTATLPALAATTPTPAAPTATATAIPATATPTAVPTICTDGMAYVADVNLNDNNMQSPPVMSPGQAFTKTWRVRNSGNCAWAADYLLMYVNGNRPEAQMGAQPVAVGQVVQPGQEIDLSVNLVAPYTYGTFQAFFQMRNNAGVYFGQVIWAGITVPDPNPPTATPVPTATADPASQVPQPNLRVDNAYITAGQCTTIRWDVDNVSAVYFIDNGNPQGKGGHDSQSVCPTQTTTYELEVVSQSNVSYSYYITVNVSGNPNNGYTMNFTADSTSINKGECTTLRWNVQGVSAVYLDGQGVAGVSSTQVCPTEDTVYTLVAVKNDGSQDSRQVRIQVSDGGNSGGGDDGRDDEDDNGDDDDNDADGSSGPRIDWFKVDKNTVSNGSCVVFNWRVSDASGVNISRGGTYILQGGTPDDELKDCPPGPGTYDYTLEAYGHTGNSSQSLTVEVRP